MPTSALWEISSIPALVHAWTITQQRIPKRSRSASYPGELSVSDFAGHQDLYLKDISQRLRASTPFSFFPLRAAILPKKNHGYRIICVPSLTDRIVQRSLLRYLTEGDKCGIINSVSFGFIEGRGVKSAAKRACKLRKAHPWAYKTDIAKFFDSIDRTVLKDLIRRRVKQRSLHPLLFSAVNCEIRESIRSRREKIAQAGIRHGHGVRQGMPLSPLFANLVLRDFDRAAEHEGLHMVRYADDLIVFADTESQCHAIHDFCDIQLSKLDLQIPSPGVGSKTQIYGPNDEAEFLGVGLVKAGGTYALKVLQLQKDKILQQLTDSLDFPTLLKNGVTISKLNQRIEGTIAAYLSVYDFCENVSQLEIALDRAKVDGLARIFEKGLGINIGKLTSDQKRFLGL